MGVLDGKSAIVTGSARGIGRATAELLVAQGAQCLINDLDGDVAEQAASRDRRRDRRVRGRPDQAGRADQLVQKAIDSFGKIDIIVNNAGYTLDAPIHKMTDEHFQAMLDIHTVVPFRVIRAAAPHLREPAKKEREEGKEVFRKIVNVSSTSGTFGNAGQANYSAGKAGVVGLTKTVAKEWGQFKVNVNAVAFGFIDTRLTQAKVDENTMEKDGEKIQLGIPEQMRQMASMLIPLGRPATPEEAAGGVFFLCSPWSNYVHGQTLHVTGGHVRRDDRLSRPCGARRRRSRERIQQRYAPAAPGRSGRRAAACGRAGTPAQVQQTAREVGAGGRGEVGAPAPPPRSTEVRSPGAIVTVVIAVARPLDRERAGEVLEARARSVPQWVPRGVRRLARRRREASATNTIRPPRPVSMKAAFADDRVVAFQALSRHARAPRATRPASVAAHASCPHAAARARTVPPASIASMSAFASDVSCGSRSHLRTQRATARLERSRDERPSRPYARARSPSPTSGARRRRARTRRRAGRAAAARRFDAGGHAAAP